MREKERRGKTKRGIKKFRHALRDGYALDFDTKGEIEFEII